MPNNISVATGFPTNFDVGVPLLTDPASIVDAFRWYHYGPTYSGTGAVGGIEKHFEDVYDYVNLTFTGSTSITTVGSIYAGEWNGTVISPTYGGTGISSLGTGIATWLGTPTSANLISAITDETGTGYLVFSDSPALTGTPTAPTAAGGTNTTQIATTAFVQAATAALINSAPAALDTLNELAAALGNDANFSTTVTNALALKAPLASPTFTGVPAAPTAAVDTNTTQLATTAYVVGQGYLKSATAASTYAPLASPSLTGVPSAPTAAVDTNTTQIATTAYVVSQGYLKSATASSTYAPLASPTFTGTVTVATLDLTTASTATAATSYFVETGSDGVVRPKLISDVRTEIVTTSAVNAAAATTVGTITSGTWQGAVIGSTYIDSAIARLDSPSFTGTPVAPTAAVDTNTTQIATTAFVVGQGYLKSATAATTYAAIEDFMVIEIAPDGTAITGTSQYTFRAPFDMTITQIPRAFVSTASSSGDVQVDITANASSIFSTQLTIDATEKTSVTAATPAVLSTTSISSNAEVIFDVVSAGTGTEGLKVIVYYKRT